MIGTFHVFSQVYALVLVRWPNDTSITPPDHFGALVDELFYPKVRLAGIINDVMFDNLKPLHA